MRNVALGMQVSLDGFVARPDGSLDWAFAHFDEGLNAAILERLNGLGTVLLGRKNYEEQASTWPNQEGPFADVMNRVEKVVFSRTLSGVEWVNSRLAEGSPAEEIARLRHEDGGDIGVAGGASFAGSLAAEGLIDEYSLAVHPVVLGEGIPLFVSPTELDLVDTRRFPTGVVLSTYRSRIPAHA